ncbi:Histone-lysine N-methyltransferase SETMAR [Cucumispora dikerogammari]|nr:Histone-lysine N-methyltransferase SETMAR [Cucumispora dikerogammari]
MGFTNRNILFLDESGFNLHTSSNYGYAEVNQDSVSYQPNSRGKNISLCAVISINGLEHHKLIEGAYNIENFREFLSECFQKGIFRRNPLLIMDNVRFHHSESINQLLNQFGVERLFLPPYNPELNPIENLFSFIKSKLSAIRPRATTRMALIANIQVALNMVPVGLSEYFRSFWEKVSEILNRQ